MLRFKLLGGFDARRDDTPLPRLQQERLQSLLACLLVSPNGVIERRELVHRLRPDTTDAQARTNLRTLLTRLREALPEPERFLALDALTAGIRADVPIATDVTAFEEAVRRAAREAAFGGGRVVGSDGGCCARFRPGAAGAAEGVCAESMMRQASLSMYGAA